ncbi:hypothetical protein RND81_13G171400 [Saponaria officinalis]|uniref:Neprosin PEP catalytic domain-containing protein n=1 Tax=Saponaria officinalis TaxID=3572 RepID=A0AAW1H6L2_SAPOF
MQHAIIRTKANDAKKFIGAKAILSIHKPKVESNQWSSSRIKLINGGDSIEFGWMVNPEKFKDYEPHLYAKFAAGGKGCINTECPGYVQVDEKSSLGTMLPKSMAIALSIGKRVDGNWSLSITYKGAVYPIGYWPKTLFSSMAEVASQIEWGGEIYNPGASKSQPEMGTGKKATFDDEISAYFTQAKIADENGQYVEPYDVEEEADCKHFYTVIDAGHPGHSAWRVFYYGGTG